MSVERRVQYRPISVRQLLTELQSTTMLMIDLAYSAVLFNDVELAEEVSEMEEKVDGLKTLLMMNTAIAIRDAQDAEEMIPILRMGTVADRISDAAGDIARTVLLGIGVDPLVLEAFTKTQERLIRSKVSRSSILTGKTLKELRLQTSIGVDIIAVRRGKELFTDPSEDFLIKEDDILIARGSDVGIVELDKLAKGELETIPRPKIDVEERLR
ncbi:MAG: TrkA C-terminal domain-containing protein [Candidatus Bathyarchaeia archaeon]